MANLRVELLKKVFKEGVKSISKEDLAGLFKSSKTHLYRHDWAPERLVREGFRKGSYEDISGLYYARDPEAIPDLVGSRRKLLANIEAIPRPGAKWKTISHFTPEVEKEYDFATRLPDPSTVAAEEIIQLKPNNTLAKIRVKGKDVYRIFRTHRYSGRSGNGRRTTRTK